MGKLKKLGISFGVIFILFIAMGFLVSAGQDIEQDRLKTPKLSFEQIKEDALYDVLYDDLFRNNEDYINKIIYFEGKVIQVQKQYGDVYHLRISSNDNSFDDVIWVSYAGPRILNNDVVGVYGTVKGIISYNAVLGQTIEIPEIDSLYLDVIKELDD